MTIEVNLNFLTTALKRKRWKSVHTINALFTNKGRHLAFSNGGVVANSGQNQPQYGDFLHKRCSDVKKHRMMH